MDFLLNLQIQKRNQLIRTPASSCPPPPFPQAIRLIRDSQLIGTLDSSRRAGVRVWGQDVISQLSQGLRYREGLVTPEGFYVPLE